MPLRGTLGQAAERRPTGKMLRRRKMLGIAPRDAPQRPVHYYPDALTGRFVRRRFDYGLILSQLHQFDFDLDTN
jgi:hypothetical protein